MPKLNISSKEDKAIKSFINKLSDRLNHNLVIVKLFGSKARGEAQKNSDIDVLVVTKMLNRKTEENISGAVQEVLIDKEVEISAISFSLKEYEKLIRERSLFMQTVQRDGIDLWKAA